METFDFPYHTWSTRFNPEPTTKGFGGGWSHASEPRTPIVRTFVLKMSGMKYYSNVDDSLDETSVPQLNAWVLEMFYERHRLNTSFIYPHPNRGNLVVRFAAQLELPEVGNFGMLPTFDISLIQDLNNDPVA